MCVSPQIYKTVVDMFGRKKDIGPAYCWFIVEALKDSSRTFTYEIDIQEIESPQAITFVVHNMEGEKMGCIHTLVLDYILDWSICVL